MKGGTINLPGQFSLFDLAETQPVNNNTPTPNRAARRKAKKAAPKKVRAATKAEEEKILTPEDYLKKADILTSLAKSRFKEELENLTLSDYEKKLYDIELDRSGTIFEIVDEMAKAIRLMLRGETEYDKDGEFMKFLRRQIPDIPFSLEPLKGVYIYDGPDGDQEDVFESSSARKCRFCWHKSDDLLFLVIADHGTPEMPIVGYRGFSHPAKSKDQLFKGYGSCKHAVDIAVILAWLICISQFNRLIADKSKREVLKSAIVEEGPFEKSLLDPKTFMVGVDEATFGHHNHASLTKALMDYGETFFERMTNDSKAPIVVPDNEPHRPSEAFVSYVEEKCCLPSGSIKVMDETERRRYEPLQEAWQEKNRKRARETKIPRPMNYILDRGAELAFIASDPFEAADHGMKVRLAYLQHECEDYNPTSISARRPYWVLPLYRTAPVQAVLTEMAPVLKTLFAERKAQVAAAKYYGELGSKEHAHSYETKKNIPVSTVKEMQESTFNKFFGYVEFDELCDLDKVRVIADEFTAMKETYFKSLDLKEVQIRFRRLGNHHASGLYYPMLGCLCVDIGEPSSLTHELGHCIDHVVGGARALSEEDSFFPVWNRYSYLLDRYILTGDAEKIKRLKGKTKYNASYYRIKTEVFARSFEMYCTRVLGITCSICKPELKESDFAYPDDEKFMGMVKKYFDDLLESRLNRPVKDSENLESATESEELKVA